MPFGLWAQVGPRNYALHLGPDPLMSMRKFGGMLPLPFPLSIAVLSLIWFLAVSTVPSHSPSPVTVHSLPRSLYSSCVEVCTSE